MPMNFCIEGDELRKALYEVEAAERNGFHFCRAVFGMKSAGAMLGDCLAEYSDLDERASATDASLDWGRLQGVTKRYKFKSGKLIPINKKRGKK